jgi:hypothetical protein
MFPVFFVFSSFSSTRPLVPLSSIEPGPAPWHFSNLDDAVVPNANTEPELRRCTQSAATQGIKLPLGLPLFSLFSLFIL